jgi:hypothetical protein
MAYVRRREEESENRGRSRSSERARRMKDVIRKKRPRILRQSDERRAPRWPAVRTYLTSEMQKHRQCPGRWSEVEERIGGVEKRWRECGSRDGLFVKGVDGRPRLERFGVDVSEGAGQVEAVEVGRSGEGDVSLGTLPSSGEVRLLEGERSREQGRVSSVLR